MTFPARPTQARSVRNRSLLLSLALPVVLGAFAGCGGADQAVDVALPGNGDDAGRTVLYRDTWGVAHLYAPTVEGGMYAMGYGQAQDRPEQLLLNFVMAIGEFSTYAGEDGVQVDLRSRMFDHYGAGKRGLPGLRAELRSHLDAFVAGINAFYREHPEDVPEWWGDREIDAAMVLAFGRLFLYNWSIDEAYEDLERGGVDAGFESTSRGSNQFVVAPSRSATGNAILAIDPHLSWTGPSRFWEFRVHAGEWEGSGVTLPGSPYIGLGHTRHLAWAMTTGGPDTADVFRLELDPTGTRYRYDGEWRDLERREVTLQVGDGQAQTHTLWSSHHGPLIAIRDGKGYAAAISYGDMVTLEAWYQLNFGRDYTGAVRALDTLSVFPQNVMVADTSGNIYYQRTGRVPVRPEGFDYSVPVDGSTSDSEWQGVHPSSDHLQVLNPPQGYMQNCNIAPDAMMQGSPFRLEEHPDYLFSGPGYGPARSGWTSQRGARAVELLAADDSVTVEEAMAYINDVEPYGADRWIDALRAAHEQHGGEQTDERYAPAVEALLSWDGRLARDSPGALFFDSWKRALRDQTGPEGFGALREAIDDLWAIVEGREEKPVELDHEQHRALAAAVVAAAADIEEDFGSLDAVYGDRYRVGRDDDSWPAGGGGGGQVGLTTLRNVSWTDERDDRTRRGRSGQTSTQVVELSDPPRSWMYIPLGNSDRPDSPHYDDQAEKAFSPRQLKPTWWLPQDLAQHLESRTVLEGAPGAATAGEDAAGASGQ
ncbi:MAG TPA: penicillin acylase family protein [Thermoanaerobaculia bacterium]|nr:penicillin acylase family protein [Thermoanaerobaculia bacterium]